MLNFKSHTMKRVILIITCLTIISCAYAGNPAYTKKMKETLEVMHAAQSAAEFTEVANSFTRISNIAKEEWLPLYYHANIYINMIYVDKEADNEQKEKYLAIARKSVEQLLATHSNEVEVQVLDAWYWISRIGLKPMVYGMLYIGKYSSAIERALAIEVNNPRAIFLDLSNKIGKAEFFGNDISEYCVDVKKLYYNWEDYQRKSELHPIWGKDGLASHLEKCK